MDFNKFFCLIFNIVFIPHLIGANIYGQVMEPISNSIDRKWDVNMEHKYFKGNKPNKYSAYNGGSSRPLIAGEGAIDAKTIDYPYVVQVFQRSMASNRRQVWRFRCTGAILDRKVIIVSGFCIGNSPYKISLERGSNFAILAGEDYHDRPRSDLDSRYKRVESFTMHPLSKILNGTTGMEYDIALLKLSEELNFEESEGKIGKITICRRDGEYWANVWNEGVPGLVVGWGWKTGRRCCEVADTLKVMHQEIITNYQCQKRLDERIKLHTPPKVPHCLIFCSDDYNDDNKAYLCKTDTGVLYIINGTLYGIAAWFQEECPDWNLKNPKTDMSRYEQPTRIVMYNKLSSFGLYDWIIDTTKKLMDGVPVENIQFDIPRIEYE
ncbi:uncharacterized protein LOC123296340 [Chrysoperla carnea]|uniref:uncharacterized protein LOC123296340 n=1 Tax=Chrysoperla carnea TaxID=189513 RepID=UPI001D08C7C3|nr:uncharacterized protein LOC123296340 [Chrysoperla carnea]